LVRQMFEEVACEHNVKTFGRYFSRFGTVLLDDRDVAFGKARGIRVKIHSKLPTTMHGIDELTMPATEVWDRSLRGNPPPKE